MERLMKLIKGKEDRNCGKNALIFPEKCHKFKKKTDNNPFRVHSVVLFANYQNQQFSYCVYDSYKSLECCISDATHFLKPNEN